MEENKKKIAIASILKPVDETRMFHKIGKSLAKEGYEVYIAGFSCRASSTKIKLYPFFSFSRISIQRLYAPLKILIWLFRIKPVVFILTTHELLPTAAIYKLFSGRKIIYDIQENYYLNIRLTNAFPFLIRNFIASYVRLKEIFFIKFIDHCFLAEAGYLEELEFIKNRHYTILENKALTVPLKNKDNDHVHEIKLIFTGTLAESTGIFQCLEMAKKLHTINQNIHFTIAGVCHLKEDYETLKKEADKANWIRIVGGNQQVDHTEILSLIRESDAAFIYYPEIELIKNTMPTKLYEYLSYKIPILLQDFQKWVNLANHYNAAIPIDFYRFDAQHTLRVLKNSNFYTTSPGIEVLWSGEEGKLIDAIQPMLGS